MYTHDIIIIGAGIIGSSMALALAQQKWRVALLDKQAPTAASIEPSLRVSNINVTVEKYLNALGVFFPENRGIFKEIKVYQQNSTAELNFSAQSVGLPYLGSIIENNVLVNTIQSQLTKTGQVDCFWPVEIEKVSFTATAAAVDLPQTRLSAPLIIGAAGAQDLLLKQCKLNVTEKSYHQTALVAQIACQNPHQYTAYQRFLSQGPLAYLPLQDKNHCSIVWSSVPEHIQHLLHLSKDALADEIAQALMHVLGEVEVISNTATFPLTMRHAKTYIAPRMAFIGDAIHTLHPLAGQGANLGLWDVAALASALAFAKTHAHRDIGSLSVLRQFERRRKLPNTLMVHVMQLLAQNQQPMAMLRGLGLQAAGNSSMLKKWMIKSVLGPRLDSFS